MKTRLLQIVAGFSMVLFSVAVFAGGTACDSKKGAHKVMSAEAMKEHKDSHAWLFSEDHHGKGEVKASPEKPEEKLITL
jgi:hypothetical protein